MSEFGDPISQTGTLQELQFELDGFMVTVHTGSFVSGTNWQFAIWDDAGNQIADYADIPGPHGAELLDIETLWHVRDDGGGAFTMFYLSDPLDTRSGVTQSFDAAGNLLS